MSQKQIGAAELLAACLDRLAHEQLRERRLLQLPVDATVQQYTSRMLKCGDATWQGLTCMWVGCVHWLEMKSATAGGLASPSLEDARLVGTDARHFPASISVALEVDPMAQMAAFVIACAIGLPSRWPGHALA